MLVLRGDGDEERTEHELGCVVERALVIVQARHFPLLHQIVLDEADGELELDQIVHIHPLNSNLIDLAPVFVELIDGKIDGAPF